MHIWGENFNNNKNIRGEISQVGSEEDRMYTNLSLPRGDRETVYGRPFVQLKHIESKIKREKLFDIIIISETFWNK